MQAILSAAIPVAIIGLVCGVILSVASHVLAVQEDDRLTAFRSALPGVNCGACGYSGCDGYALALASGKEAHTTLCSSGGVGTAAALAALLGIDAPVAERQIAHVFCRGSCEHTAARVEYHGIQSCAAAHLLYSGPGQCAYGCLGYGDCAAVCPQDAIRLEQGLASVNRSRCLGCGQCAVVCPSQVIRCIPNGQLIAVSCSSHDNGRAVRLACKVGCIGCGQCVKTCPSDAVRLEQYLAVVDVRRCTGCSQCIAVCPTTSLAILAAQVVHGDKATQID